jgi:hypothetical protein
MLVFEFIHEKFVFGALLVTSARFTTSPGQTVKSAGSLKTGVGFIVTVNCCDEPPQPVKLLETVIVPTIGAPELFTGALKVAISPDPEAARPMLVFEFTQENIAPRGFDTKFVGSIGCPAQTVMSASVFPKGVGLMEMVKISVGLAQPFNVPTTEILVEIALGVAFAAAVNAGILLVPVVAARPTAGFEFIHANVPPVGVVVKLAGATLSPGQTDKSGNAVTTGVGLTVTPKFCATLTQPFTVAVAVMMPVTLTPLLLAAALNDAI